MSPATNFDVRNSVLDGSQSRAFPQDLSGTTHTAMEKPQRRHQKSASNTIHHTHQHTLHRIRCASNPEPAYLEYSTEPEANQASGRRQMSASKRPRSSRHTSNSPVSSQPRRRPSVHTRTPLFRLPIASQPAAKSAVIPWFDCASEPLHVNCSTAIQPRKECAKRRVRKPCVRFASSPIVVILPAEPTFDSTPPTANQTSTTVTGTSSINSHQASNPIVYPNTKPCPRPILDLKLKSPPRAQAFIIKHRLAQTRSNCFTGCVPLVQCGLDSDDDADDLNAMPRDNLSSVDYEQVTRIFHHTGIPEIKAVGGRLRDERLEIQRDMGGPITEENSVENSSPLNSMGKVRYGSNWKFGDVMRIGWKKSDSHKVESDRKFFSRLLKRDASYSKRVSIEKVVDEENDKQRKPDGKGGCVMRRVMRNLFRRKREEQ